MSSWRSALRRLAGTATVLLACAVAASAQEAPSAPPTGLAVELNTANDVDGGCRLAFVAFNGTPSALDAVSYELVVFDGSQRISQVVILEFGALPQRKTKIVRFDIANAKCADFSRIIINGAARCESGGTALPICLDEAKPSSRAAIALSL